MKLANPYPVQKICFMGLFHPTVFKIFIFVGSNQPKVFKRFLLNAEILVFPLPIRLIPMM